MHRRRAALSLARTAVAAVCLLFASNAAEAAQCTVTTTSVNFGSYNVFDTAPTDSTGSVTLNCNGGAKNVVVEISRGGAPSASLRFMNRGGEVLFYNLYQNAARTIIWGDGAGASPYYLGNPANNQDVRLTIYGRVPAGQDVSAGTYTDTVTVTVQH
jgi:spore coat protein U-like protein